MHVRYQFQVRAHKAQPSFPMHTGLYSYISRLTVVSRESKKKQHACAYSGPSDHYSELFTRMAALKFKNAVTQPP